MNQDLFCSGGCWCSRTTRPPWKKRGTGTTGAGKADIFARSVPRRGDLFFRPADCVFQGDLGPSGAPGIPGKEGLVGPKVRAV